MRVYPIGCFSLVASHKLHSVDCIPQVTFPRFIPKAHSKGSSRTAHLIVSRVAFYEANMLPHSDIMPSVEIINPGHRHPRNPPFAPHSSKHMLIAGGSITFAFSLLEVLQYLCRCKEQSRIAGRTRATSEPSIPYHLRDSPIGKFVSKALHPLHSFSSVLSM